MTREPPPTTTPLLQIGHYFLRDEQLYQITLWDPHRPLDIEARRLADDVCVPFVLTDLFAPTPLTRFGATPTELLAPAPAPPPVEPAGLPDALLTRATHIIQTVEAVVKIEAHQLDDIPLGDGKHVNAHRAFRRSRHPENYF